MRTLFVWVHGILLLTLLWAIAQDHFREWKPYQKKYGELSGRKRPAKIGQILASDLKRVDRCITCHQGYDPAVNPELRNDWKEAGHPWWAPDLEVHRLHPVEKFGCTVCHEGQGWATTFYDAGHRPKDEAQKKQWEQKYGWKPLHNWEKPMLPPPYIQASCLKCHQNFETLKGAEVAATGRKLYVKYGCVACHAIDGEGGAVSEDLGEIADKPLVRIDFAGGDAKNPATGLPRDEWNLLNWIRIHFTRDPALNVPGDPRGEHGTEPIPPSGMPFFMEEDPPEERERKATALTTYLLGLSRERKQMPQAYVVPMAKPPEPTFASSVDRGKYLYEVKYGCVGCHGPEGSKPIKNFNAIGGRAAHLKSLVGTFTRAELRRRIEEGVTNMRDRMEDPRGPIPPIYMPSWKDRIPPKDMEDLLDYLFSIAEKEETWGE